MRKSFEILTILLGLLGAILISISFQAASSLLRSATINEKGEISKGWCVGDREIFGVDSHTGVEIDGDCSKAYDSKPIAIINADQPKFAYWGIGLVIASFIIQFILAVIPKKELSRSERRQLERKQH